MNKTDKTKSRYKDNIKFNLPLDDPARMKRIYEGANKLLVCDYQIAYDKLPNEHKEIGLEILKKEFQERTGKELLASHEIKDKKGKKVC